MEVEIRPTSTTNEVVELRGGEKSMMRKLLAQTEREVEKEM
jgi:hypothetical protein